MTIRIVSCAALIALATSTASADEMIASPSMTLAAAPPAATWKHPLFYFGGGASGRVIDIDEVGSDYVDTLDAYGYENTGNIMLGLYVFGGFRALPIADVGVVGEYSYIHNAQPSDTTISMRTHSKQLGVFARPRITPMGSVVDLGVRAELGLIHSSTTLRQESLGELSGYARAELELMVGTERMGAHLHVGYMRAFGRDDFDPYIAPALGGVSFGLGVFRRY